MAGGRLKIDDRVSKIIKFCYICIMNTNVSANTHQDLEYYIVDMLISFILKKIFIKFMQIDALSCNTMKEMF